MAHFQFDSDNASPVSPEVMQALVDCNTGTATAYGDDIWSKRLRATFCEFFEHDCHVFPVSTGTAGNGLALASITPPYGTMFCHRKAHILTTEGGAPEFYTAGGRVAPLDGRHNKLSPDILEQALHAHSIGGIHSMEASAVSLTQATECGVTYDLDELVGLSEVARAAGLKVHMDGARFSNAVLHRDCTAADMTWKAGVDVLTFGTTKNGTMNAEAVVTFDGETADRLRMLYKRSGQLFSKMRFMSAQLLAHLENDLWRRNAERANANAVRLAKALLSCPGVVLLHPNHINELFVTLPPTVALLLEEDGFPLRPWPHSQAQPCVRLVASYSDDEKILSAFEQACGRVTETMRDRRVHHA